MYGLLVIHTDAGDNATSLLLSDAGIEDQARWAPEVLPDGLVVRYVLEGGFKEEFDDAVVLI